MTAIIPFSDMPASVADGSPSDRDSAPPGIVEYSEKGFPSHDPL